MEEWLKQVVNDPGEYRRLIQLKHYQELTKGYKIKHIVAHWFGLNGTQSASAYDEQHRLWTGRECCTCGKVTHTRLSRAGRIVRNRGQR